MCCCGKPTINGEPGAYSWDGKTFSTRPPAPPELSEGDELLHDEPGRCGGVDSHCHHFRVVRQKFGGFALLVRHGGGTERVDLGYRTYLIRSLPTLDSNGRYWLLLGLFGVQYDAAKAAAERANANWRQAAADKRIKTRKLPRGTVKVWINPPSIAAAKGGM